MKTKKTIMIITLSVLLLLFVGCTSNKIDNENKYANATITLERSGMYTMEEYAIQRITIDEKGLLHETFYPNQTLTHSAYTEFHSDEYEQIMNLIKASDFYELEDEYHSPVLVADVGQGVISVETKDNKKSILINPYIEDGNPSKITKIMEKINELTNNANSPYELVVSLMYQGIQCEDEPWDAWYREGNINFIKAPTTSELIVAYYSSKNIEIINIEELSDGVVCQACSVCPDSNYYIITVNPDYKDALLEEGWVE